MGIELKNKQRAYARAAMTSSNTRNFEPILLCLFLYLLCIVPSQATELSDLKDPKVADAFVDRFVLTQMQEKNVPWGVVSIEHEGQRIFHKGYGFQDRAADVRFDADTSLTRIASISKLFTWVAVLQLVEQGKLDLDLDVNSYLTSFQVKNTFPGQPITLRHIMTHTSGFEDNWLGHTYTYEPGAVPPLAAALERYEPKRVLPPGLQTAYSNYATALAGLVVEEVSGVEFRAYAQRNIFDVLGMSNTTFYEPVPEAMAAQLTNEYRYGGGQFHEMPFRFSRVTAPAGAAISTAVDVLKFGRALQNGGAIGGQRILRASTVDQMFSRQFAQDDRLTGIGLGIIERQTAGGIIFGHGGDRGSYHSYLGIDPTNDLTIFVSFGGRGGSTLRTDFINGFYTALFPARPNAIMTDQPLSKPAETYAGSYMSWRSNFSGLGKALNAFGAAKIDPAGQNALWIDDGREKAKFVEIEEDLFQKLGGVERIAFQQNKKGEITGFVTEAWPTNSLFRAPLLMDPDFNHPLLLVVMIVFGHIIVRSVYQRRLYWARSGGAIMVSISSLLVAMLGGLTLLSGPVIFSNARSVLWFEVPMALELWLWAPIVFTGAVVFHLYAMWGAFFGAAGTVSFFRRIEGSLLLVSAAWLVWFFAFWNLLGFQYRS